MHEFWAKATVGPYHRVTRASGFLRPACYPYAQHMRPEPSKVHPLGQLEAAIEAGLVNTCERCKHGS